MLAKRRQSSQILERVPKAPAFAQARGKAAMIDAEGAASFMLAQRHAVNYRTESKN